MAMMAAGIEAYRASGQRIALSALLGWLTEMYVDAGNAAAAGAVVAEGRAFASATGELRYLPESHRLEGELHQLRGNRNAAEQSFLRAIDLARDHGSRWWELRTTVSLARLQQRRGKRDGRRAAHDVLAAIVGKFTEGFDTVDVQQAQALLAELA
jgi:predicted ATPase